LAITTEQSSLSVLGPPKAAGSPPCADAAPRSEPPAAATAAPAVGDYDFAEIYEGQFDFVWRSLRLLGVPPEGVEDAAQDVFSVASRQLARFEGRASIRTWLFAILQRVAANHRRTRRRKLSRLEPLGDGVVSMAPTPQARAEAAQALDVVQRFCAALDLDRRALFVLALVEEVPAAEVSEVLGIPVNTVYSRVRTLREGLRRALEEHEAPYA
jgi:RNA polymerase sigma-70 factor (ECF subfamily)